MEPKNIGFRRRRMGSAGSGLPHHETLRGNRQFLAGAAEDLPEFRAALAPLREIHWAVARSEESGALNSSCRIGGLPVGCFPADGHSILPILMRRQKLSQGDGTCRTVAPKDDLFMSFGSRGPCKKYHYFNELYRSAGCWHTACSS